MTNFKDLCFVDSETTSLSAEYGEIWEWAGIRRNHETGEETRMLLQIECDLGTADPFSLSIGRYYDRFGKNGHWEPETFYADNTPVSPPPVPQKGEVCFKSEAAKLISDFTRGTHLIGNVISFDSERMERLLRSWDQCPGWHYHVQDVEPLLVGWLIGNGAKGITLPYKSDELSALAGVPLPTDAERHTAMGDAEWVMRQWDTVWNVHAL